MPTLTKTQIDAVIIKAKRTFLADVAEIDRNKENAKFFEPKIKADLKGLHPAIIKRILSDNGLNSYYGIQRLVDEMGVKAAKKYGFPYPDPKGDAKKSDERRAKFEAMLADLRFELTMAGTEDWQQYLDTFNKKVSAL